MGSAFDAQQQREVANRGRFWDWPSVRAAVEAARGARECSDVEAEQTALACVTVSEHLWFGSAAGLKELLPPSDPARATLQVFSIPQSPDKTLVDSLWEDLER